MENQFEPKLYLFHKSIRNWGENHIRDFPWRFRDDPYAVLVSEFMLQRTQVNQVLPIYIKFMEKFPDLSSLIKSEEKEIFEILRPLGLGWRIKGMVKTLKTIYETHTTIPEDYDKLIAYQGIGQYIGGATLCFSKNIPFTIIDTNIIRVIGRYFGFEIAGEVRRKKSFVQSISGTIDQNEPRKFYYSIIDIAHQYCLPTSPDCENCPLSEAGCLFFLEKQKKKKK